MIETDTSPYVDSRGLGGPEMREILSGLTARELTELDAAIRRANDRIEAAMERMTPGHPLKTALAGPRFDCNDILVGIVRMELPGA